MLLGLDEMLGTIRGGVLVRIDPTDAKVTVVGKVEPLGRFAFSGKDLYMGGTTELRRIRAVVP